MSRKFRPTTLAALLLAITVTKSSALPMNERPRLNTTFLTYTAEAAGGYAGAVLGVAAGFITASLIYPGGGDAGWRALFAICFPAAAVGCAGGTHELGAACRQDGRFLPTLAYSACAVVGGVGLYYAGTRVKHGDVPAWQGNVGFGMTYVGGAVVLLAPVIATYGYNRSRPRDSYGSRFLPGSVGLASVRDADGIIHPALAVHLLTVRF